VSGTLSFSDADPTDVHVVPSPVPGSATGYVGIFTAAKHVDSTGGGTGTVDLKFSVALDDLQALPPGPHPQTYTITVTDGRGGTVSTTITIPLGDDGGGGGGGGHDPVIFVAAGDSDGITVVDNAAISPHIRQGTLSFSDQDIQDSHFASAIVQSVDPSGAWGTAFAFVSPDTTGSGTGGKISWNYQVGEFPKVQALGLGESHFEEITVALDSPGEHVTHDVMVHIVGSNDAPVVQPDTLVANVPGSWTAAGGPVTLQFAQKHQLLGCRCARSPHRVGGARSDAHHRQRAGRAVPRDVRHVKRPGRQGALDLRPHQFVDAIRSRTRRRAAQAHLRCNDRRRAWRRHGAVRADFQQPAVIPGDATTQMEVTSPAVAGNLGFSEVDPDHHVIEAHFDRGHSSGDGPRGTFDFSVLNDVSSGTGGLTHWEYHVSQAARDTLMPGQTWIDSFVATFDDGHGGIASHQFTFTLHGPDII
jgi:VCBS repeat-containing protein